MVRPRIPAHGLLALVCLILVRNVPGAAEVRKPEAFAEVSESFDKTAAKTLPKGWSSNAAQVFGGSTGKPLNGAGGLACSGTSTSSGRAWMDQSFPADLQVSVAVHLNSLVPIQILLRGKDLDGSKPTYYGLQVARGLQIQLIQSVKGKSTNLATLRSTRYLSEKWVRIVLQARGNALKAQLYCVDTKEFLDDTGEWTPDPAWALSVKNEEIAEAGQVGIGRLVSYAGTVFLDDLAIKPPSTEDKVGGSKSATDTGSDDPTDTPPLPLPAIPRHYKHIRIAALAYNGNPMSPFEDKLLRESIDLVIPNTNYLKHIQDVAPNTPQLIYTNTSNLYLNLLLDWLSYAQKNGLQREAAFYHVRQARPFTGDSPSSKPVTWLWGVHRGGRTLQDLTSRTQSKTPAPIGFGASNESVYLGYPDRFGELNIQLASAPGGSWSAELEYPTRVDDKGHAVQWSSLKTIEDGTSRLTRSGTLRFDPPADWVPASVNASAELYYVRYRTTGSGNPPVAGSILGRDYVEAKGQTTGTVPAFDTTADQNNDGYLDDAEYKRRDPARNARFLYESRVFSGYYGQMRFATNPSSEAFRKWAVDYHKKFMAAHPLADGLFMDNSEGKPPVTPAEVIEPLRRYAEDYGRMVNDIAHAIGPKWIIVNTAGGLQRADPVVKRNPIYLEEFAIRPLAHHYVYFEDLAALVSRRAKMASPAAYAIIDSHPQKGLPTDPRMLLGTLAYYYLLADPESTFLMFFGGHEPATSWKRHWTEAVAFDIGQPAGKWSQFATGVDPSNKELSYRIYQRPYDKALVLFKPLAYARGSKAIPSSGDESATRHDLDGMYRPLQADGSLGAAIKAVSLRNGEGAILVKSR